MFRNRENGVFLGYREKILSVAFGIDYESLQCYLMDGEERGEFIDIVDKVLDDIEQDILLNLYDLGKSEVSIARSHKLSLKDCKDIKTIAINKLRQSQEFREMSYLRRLADRGVAMIR